MENVDEKNTRKLKLISIHTINIEYSIYQGHMQKVKSQISCFPWLSQLMIKDRVKIFFFICCQTTGA